MGLTGTPAEIEAVAKAYRVYVKKVPDPKSTAGYTIDHSSHHLRHGTGRRLPHALHARRPASDAMAERLGKLLP